MLVICSGALLCDRICRHKETHYVTHLNKGTRSRVNCATRRCSNGLFTMPTLVDYDFYFECVPWVKGIEKTFVDKGMNLNTILKMTRWYSQEHGMDGYLSTEPEEGLEQDDEEGMFIPRHLAKKRNVSINKLVAEEPPMHSNEPDQPRMTASMIASAPAVDWGRITRRVAERNRLEQRGINRVRMGTALPTFRAANDSATTSSSDLSSTGAWIRHWGGGTTG